MNQPAPSTRPLMKRAAAALQKNKGQEALELFNQVVTLNPSHAEALYNIGFIMHSSGHIARAAEYYQRAIQADPAFMESYFMFCKLLEAQNRGEEAIEFAKHIVGLAPDLLQSHVTLADMLLRFNQPHLVPAYLEQVMPKFPKATSLLQVYCMALKINGRFDEAEIAYRRMLREHRVPAAARVVYELFLPRVYQSNAQIDRVREQFSGSVEGFIQEKPRIQASQFNYEPVFQLAFHNRDNKALLQRYTAMLRLIMPEVNYTAAHCKGAPTSAEGRAVRVGFVSAHMYQHSVGSCYRHVMLTLAREPGFEVTFFDLSHVEDDKIQQIRDANVPLVALPKNLASAQALIAGHKLDILIYPDIGMDATTHYLALARLATHQACFQGHPETSGMGTIDYFITSRYYEPPEAQENYTERLLCYPGMDTIFKRPKTPDRFLTRGELGLPEDKKLYVCPMAIQKFHPDFDDVLAGIVSRDPEAVLVLFNDFQQASASHLIQQRLLTKIPAERIFYMPWLTPEALFSVMKLADCLLDTIHFGGGTTGQLAFHFGLPVVTMPGSHARGRMLFAYYSIMGIENAPLAKGTGEYIEIACRLANDKDYWNGISEQILAKNGAMFEAASSAPTIIRLMKDIMAGHLEGYRK